MPNNQDLQKRIAQLERDVAMLMKWKEEKEKNQLKYPLDKATMYALDNAFRNFTLTQLNVKDIYLYPQMTYPTVAGQIRFFNDLVVQDVRINLGTYEGRIVLANP